LEEETFSLEETLKCYQENNYWLPYEEHKNYNDYIVVDKDPTTCTVEELKDIQVLETYIDGKLVYEKSNDE
jgi:predicted amidohydrolase YtcJ